MELDWWNKNAKESIEDFKLWVGDHTAPTKQLSAQMIMEKGYKSILDVGCALCDMKRIFDEANYEINYVGLDSCKDWADIANSRGIKLLNVSIESDLSEVLHKKFDVVFSRHVLEHLPSFERALTNMLYLSRHEVINVFFLEPQDKAAPCLGEDRGSPIYHNVYAVSDLVRVCNENQALIWDTVKVGTEVIYRINKW